MAEEYVNKERLIKHIERSFGEISTPFVVREIKGFPTACASEMTADALELINRQKAEINSLEDTLCGKISASAAAILADATENLKEAERALKSEAVKEFAERLKTYYRNIDKTAGALVEYHIDQIVKEMLEGG